jgi:hypothetical protein
MPINLTAEQKHKRRLYFNEYRQKHKDKLDKYHYEYSKAYRELNRLKIRAYNTRYKREHYKKTKEA